jgi:hypothetical protein
MKLSKDILVKMHKAASRQSELENGMRVNRNRVHLSKKLYNRKRMKKQFTGLTW